jgi:hypothetical protein
LVMKRPKTPSRTVVNITCSFTSSPPNGFNGVVLRRKDNFHFTFL